MMWLGLSARVYHRILKVSRNIAEFEDFESYVAAMVARGVGYRSLDRAYWT